MNNFLFFFLFFVKHMNNFLDMAGHLLVILM